MRNWLLSGLIFFLFVAVFISNFFIPREFFSGLGNKISSVFYDDVVSQNESLRRENENLRAQLQNIPVFKEAFSPPAGNILEANIFSNYPLSIKNEIIIDKGLRDGVKNGSTILYGDSILVGTVVDAQEDWSRVRTVFDPQWQLAVKIGDEQINGLFKGGNTPKIVLSEKPIHSGNAIFCVGAGLMYGVKIGDVAEVREGVGGILKEADIVIPYSLSEITKVFVSLDS